MIELKHRKIVVKMLLISVAMFGFGYALVPLYDLFCDVTGLNGKTNSTAIVSVASPIDTTRSVTIEFVASVDSRGSWRFKPLTTRLEVHPGEVHEIFYEAENRHGKAADGQAVPSVVPGAAAKYLQKIECFCFNRQAFDAGEKKDMKVKFVVDPALPAEYNTLTLAYTLYTAPEN